MEREIVWIRWIIKGNELTWTFKFVDFSLRIFNSDSQFFPIHRIMDFRDIINTHDNESVQVLVGLTIGSCLTSRKSISVGKLKCVTGGLSFDISYLKRIHEFLSPFLYFSPIVECVLSLEKSYRSIYHLCFNSFE